MADLLDSIADYLREAIGAGRQDILPSAAPGGGPSAGREGPKDRGGTGGDTPGPRHGNMPQATLGYGGHGDPTVLVDAPAHTRKELQELIQQTERTRQRDRLRTRFRFQIPYSPEGHNQDGWRFVVGPWSMLDATQAAAPSAGNSTQNITLTIPANTAGPFVFLDRYPGALYFLIYVRTFAWMPLGTAMTGQQELFYTDPGGAVVGLGIYNAATLTNGVQNVGALCNTPITDPGNAALGQITVTNIGIGGTPVAARYQIGLGFVAMVPDPWFQAQQVRPPTPADVTATMLALQEARP